MNYGTLLWQPSRERRLQSAMARFARELGVFAEGSFVDDAPDEAAYDKLYRWSLDHNEAFWLEASRFLGVHWQTAPRCARERGSPRTGTPHRMLDVNWFPGGVLNYAENIFKGIETCKHQDAVVVGLAEGATRREWSAQRLRQETLQCQKALLHVGTQKGSRICGVLSHVPEGLVAMLAVASLGAIWSSSSPDFGADGVVDRFAPLAPQVLFMTKRYEYAGKEYSTEKMVLEVVGRLPSVKHVIWVDHLEHRPLDPSASCSLPGVTQWTWNNWLDEGRRHTVPEEVLAFEPCSSQDPLFILFSSGTTGLPKCIVHGHVGTLIQHRKEHVLHCDMGPNDRLFYYTTCGWMMWNWKVSALASGTSLVMYDGAVVTSDKGGEALPTAQQGSLSLWDLVDREDVTVFGTSPKFLSHCMARHILPPQDVSRRPLHLLRTILTTGSPLLPDHAAWVYDAVLPDVHLASISGGTDIISCFMLGHPLSGVRAGEIQGPGLGMAVEAWDDGGHPVYGTQGELVCTDAFPSMPLGFWNDPGHVKYKQAYFEAFDGCDVWRHGDFIEMTPTGGVVVYGRSDATLNPGGIRIGSAEIYRQVETIPGILDSLVVGVKEVDDTPMALFIKLAPEAVWSEKLVQSVKQRLRQHLSPRHVPKWIFQVADIPYTRSGKKMELAVGQILAGVTVKNRSSCANPESFEEFEQLRRRLPTEGAVPRGTSVGRVEVS